MLLVLYFLLVRVAFKTPFQSIRYNLQGVMYLLPPCMAAAAVAAAAAAPFGVFAKA